MITKWVKVDNIIENYKKRYPKRWAAFLLEMDKTRVEKTDKKAKFRLSAKFPAYPNEQDISSEILKVLPNLITSDYCWDRFKKTYPVFFR